AAWSTSSWPARAEAATHRRAGRGAPVRWSRPGAPAAPTTKAPGGCRGPSSSRRSARRPQPAAHPLRRRSVVEEGDRAGPAGAGAGDLHREAAELEAGGGGQGVEVGEALDLAVLALAPGEVGRPQHVAVA